MKIFPGWRAVGRTMMRARQQDGVTVTVGAATEIGYADVTEHRWQSDIVTVEARPNDDGAMSVDIYRANYAAVNFWPTRDAAEVLRVLAALDLIPAELAQNVDERYATCAACGHVLVWVSGNGFWDDRWNHVDHDGWLQGGPHRAEAAQ